MGIPARYRKRGMFLLWGATLLLAAVIILAPLRRRSQLIKNASIVSVPDSNSYIITDTSLLPLSMEIAWRESLLLLAQSDSIQLAVNLMDSCLFLYLKGVPIHRVPISRFRIDPVLGGLPSPVYLSIFSAPLDAKEQNSTIVKEPIVEREAPRDPVEAENMAWQPDTLIQNPAFFSLAFGNGIDLVISQEGTGAARERWVRFCFFSERRMERIIHPFHYTPSVRLSIPVNDARAIYRAMPQDAKVALCFPIR